MRASGAQHRMTDGKRGHLFCGCSLCLIPCHKFRNKAPQVFPDTFCAIFPCIPGIPGQFALDVHGKMVFARYLQKFRLNNRVQFFYHQHFIQPFQERDCQILGKRMRGSHAQKPYLFRDGFPGICIADTARGYAFPGIRLPFHRIIPVRRKYMGQFHISLLDLHVVLIGKPWEYHPAAGIF